MKRFFKIKCWDVDTRYQQEIIEWAKENDQYILDYRTPDIEIKYEVDMSDDEIVAKYGDDFVQFVESSDIFYHKVLNLLKEVADITYNGILAEVKHGEPLGSYLVKYVDDDLPYYTNMDYYRLFKKQIALEAIRHNDYKIALTNLPAIEEEVKVAEYDAKEQHYTVLAEAKDGMFTGRYYRETVDGEYIFVSSIVGAKTYESVYFVDTNIPNTCPLKVYVNCKYSIKRHRKYHDEVFLVRKDNPFYPDVRPEFSQLEEKIGNNVVNKSQYYYWPGADPILNRKDWRTIISDFNIDQMEGRPKND